MKGLKHVNLLGMLGRFKKIFGEIKKINWFLQVDNMRIKIDRFTTEGSAIYVNSEKRMINSTKIMHKYDVNMTKK